MHVIRRSGLLLLAASLAGCDRDSAAGNEAPDSAPTARAIPAVAFRLPTRSGTLGVYTLPDLGETPWGAGGRTTGARSAIGVDHQGRRLLYRDSAGAIAGFDLVAMRERPIAARNTIASLGSDGTLLAVDTAGGVIESQPWGARAWPSRLGRGVRSVFAAPGGRLIAVRTGTPDTLAIATRESGVRRTSSAPWGGAGSPSVDGDAVAFATDSGVIVVEDREPDRPWFVAISGTPRAATFSPSGHRIYVALANRNELAVVDRFARETTASVRLPGVAEALRMDPWGRAIMVRPAGTETTVWVVGTAERRVLGHLQTPWSTDLPAVAESGVLLAREGNAVVARDVRTLDSLGAVPGGADDLWFTGRWVPRSASAAARAENEPAPRAPAPATQPPARGQQSPSPARDDGPQHDAPGARGAGNFFAQVTSTRFLEGARALADTLRRDGYPVEVVEPRANDNVWRVMVGPLQTRQAADSVGRSLGRHYFVLDRSRP